MGEKLLLGIDGSPRANGNTAFLLEVALKEAERAGAGQIRTETIHLRNYKIAPCIGCFGCTTNAKEQGGSRACTAFSDGMVSAVISFARTLVFLVGMLLTLPRLLGETGIWMAVPAAELLGLAVAIGFLVWGRKKYGYGRASLPHAM